MIKIATKDAAKLSAHLRRLGDAAPARGYLHEAAGTIDALAADRDALQHKLRMIVSHATMGSTDGQGKNINEICVQITALRNELYEDAQAAARASITPDKP